MNSAPALIPPWRRLPCCGALALALSSLGCAGAPTDTPKAEASSDSAQQLMAKIRAEIGAAPCSDNAQCRSIGVGYKACGGPSSYLAWSITHSDEAKLKALVQRHAQALRAESSENKGRMVSDCRYLMDPGAVCQASRCQAGDPLGGEVLPR